MKTLQTFLITGANAGQGLELARAALHANHKVIATARNVHRAQSECPDISTLGGIWLQLDVTQPDCQQIVSNAVQTHNVTILINNAGYGLRGPVEDLSMPQIRAQMETNFFGALACTKAVIPHFRSHPDRTTIVQISSASALTGTPSQSLYSASKFALEGASESIAAELAPFNIRILLVEIGALRTDFQLAVQKPLDAMSEAYRGTPADLAARRITAAHGRQDGDPVKCAKAIVNVVTGISGPWDRGGERMGEVFRLMLGRDTLVRADSKIKSLIDDTERCRASGVATYCSFGEKWDGYPPLDEE
ncbi:putative short chain oxidoreductase/dehydrogenase [Teratosphaeria destructans]|uniref:Short chain oxidoreductase/dehydrogenase n=1 Tax=Teratosphaeria destructans TaxID=418781 RepID=A0A9W7SPY3_9PEZI|nr:putative short chain oxidoreductase/dehydrogenase [Teratosphaeria destructans]